MNPGGPSRTSRDFVGYGPEPPDPAWPRDARVAVQFVLNYEEGGELNQLDGDSRNETFVTEEPADLYPGGRNLDVESQYEYGSRAGFWRLHRLFVERNLPVTVFGVALALARNPAAVAAMQDAGWEIASHGYRWIDHHDLPPDQEREYMRRAIEIHSDVTGERPLGWYLGRPSRSTRRLVVDDGGFEYDADYFGDDLPFWTHDYGRPHLVVPYTLDNNDARFAHAFGFGGADFAEYLSGGLDLLIREGARRPRMMSIGLHCRLSGRPGRSAMLERFLDLVATRPDVWVTRRIDIARHWKEKFPP